MVKRGPLPSPNALRNRRGDVAGFERLPSTGLDEVPEWPVEVDPPSVAELSLWRTLWRERPQAHVWARVGMQMSVVLYVRNAIKAAEPDAKSAIVTAVRQLADSLMLSDAALRSNRYLLGEPAPVLALAPAPVSAPSRGGVLGRLGRPASSNEDDQDQDEDDQDDGDEDQGDD